MIALTCLIALWAPPDALVAALAAEGVARAAYESEQALVLQATAEVRRTERAQDDAEAAEAATSEALANAQGSLEAIDAERAAVHQDVQFARSAREGLVASVQDKLRIKGLAQTALSKAEAELVARKTTRARLVARLTGDPKQIAALEDAFDAEGGARDAVESAREALALATAEAADADAALVRSGAKVDAAQAALAEIDGLRATARSRVTRASIALQAALQAVEAAQDANGIALKDEMEAQLSADEAEARLTRAIEVRDAAIQAAADAVGP